MKTLRACSIIAAVLSLVFFLPAKDGTKAAKDPEMGRGQDLHADLAKLSREYDISIDWTAEAEKERFAEGGLTFRGASDADLEGYGPILISEFNLYPKSLIRKSGLKRIIVCWDLWMESEGVKQNVSGAMDYDRKTMILCASYTLKDNNRDKQRRVLHHVFFHFLDAALGLAGEHSEWEALNPKEFKYGDYGRGGIHDRSSEAGLLSDKYPGFLNKYSTGYLADDKANIFAYMMVIYDYVEKRGEQDPVIRSKMDLMKSILKQFCPDVNSGFWANVKKIKRDLTPFITLAPFSWTRSVLAVDPARERMGRRPASAAAAGDIRAIRANMYRHFYSTG